MYNIRQVQLLIITGLILVSALLSFLPANASVTATPRLFQTEEPAKISFDAKIDCQNNLKEYQQRGKVWQLSRLENRLRRKRFEQEQASSYDTSSTQYSTPPEPTYRIPIYRINIGDVINVSVWRNPDLQKDVIVRPDGLISFPLVGEVQAAGLTLTELDRIITRRLSTYVRKPEVSVAVSRFGGTKVIILGEVNRPGVYAPTGKGSVLEVVALAGGFTRDAVRSSVVLIQGGLVKPEPIRLNLARALSKAEIQYNRQLRPNDIIYVPRKWIADVNYWVRQMTPTLSNILLGTTIARDIRWLDERYVP